MSSRRFDCVSGPLNLSRLLDRTRKLVLLGLGLSVAAHLSLTRISGLRQERKVAKPLTTQFVKRQPRLTKPLELKKRPRPKRRAMQRKMVSVRAKISRQQAAVGIQAAQAARSLARPEVRVGREVAFRAPVLELQAVAQRIAGARQDKQVVDMSLEMMDVDALDTGRYHALVIEDPTDKRGIKGFLYLVLARPESISRTGGRGGGSSAWDDMCYGVRMLVEAMNQWTGIRTRILGQITFDDADLFKVPWVLTPNHGRTTLLTPGEAENMGRYLASGGFQFLDNAWGVTEGVQGLEPATRRIGQAILSGIGLKEGSDWRWERLPKGHPLYHCFYDFDIPPQAKDSDCFYVGKAQGVFRAPMHDYLEGVTMDGRLWILLSNKGYTIAWYDWSPGGHYPKDTGRLYQFGINTIIFALTQEGSITNRVMDAVQY